MPLYASGDSGSLVRLQRTAASACCAIILFSGGIGRRAELTQLVECQLPKLDVAGSNPVLRSIFPLRPGCGPYAAAARRLTPADTPALGTDAQNRLGWSGPMRR